MRPPLKQPHDVRHDNHDQEYDPDDRQGTRRKERTERGGYERAVRLLDRGEDLQPGIEHRLPATGAMIDAGAIFFVERAGAGALGAVLAQDPMLRGGQPLAPFLKPRRNPAGAA